MMLLDTELDDYVAAPESFGPVIARRLEEYAGLHEL
jgi:hypothetical protein